LPREMEIGIGTEEQLTDLLIEKERRFASYMANTREAVWRIDFDPPLSLQAPESQQVQDTFQTTVIVEANDAMARMYGHTEGRDVIGRPLADFMSQAEPENIEAVTVLVRNKFRVNDELTLEQKADGTTGVFLNNTVPTISKGMVSGMWGTSLDITDLHATKERLKQSLAEVEEKNNALEEKNIALKELIAQFAREKDEIEERVMSNVDHVILPTLEKFKLNNGTEKYLEQHRKNLQDLISTFGREIADSSRKLTPREVEVCSLIRNGVTNKEIARLLSIALHTVEKHRRMARKKLDLTHKGVNLQVYLSSL
jgi:PAS domain S-box-containing protein